MSPFVHQRAVTSSFFNCKRCSSVNGTFEGFVYAKKNALLVLISQQKNNHLLQAKFQSTILILPDVSIFVEEAAVGFVAVGFGGTAALNLLVLQLCNLMMCCASFWALCVNDTVSLFI